MIPRANIAESNTGCLMISGTLNFMTVVELWNASLSFIAKNPALQFDFSKVTAVNSAGLALLLEWLRYAKSHNKMISFDNMPKQLLSIATVAGIEKFLV